MSWVRAVWLEGQREEEEGVVPATWIIDGKLYWPNVTAPSKAIKDGRHPMDGTNTRWQEFTLIKEQIRSGI
jgi:hypothetical protein